MLLGPYKQVFSKGVGVYKYSFLLLQFILPTLTPYFKPEQEVVKFYILLYRGKNKKTVSVSYTTTYKNNKFR